MKAIRFKKKHREKPSQPKKRMLVLLCLYTLAFGLLFGRVFYLQVIQGPSLVQRALSQWTRTTQVSAKRGNIVDRNGEVLAQSSTADTVLLYPQKIASSKDKALAQTIATKLAPILEMEEAAILEKAQDKTKSEVWLKRQITAEQADAIRALNLTGVGFIVDTKRYYPKGDFLTQVLGFTSVDGEGIEGLEAYYNKYLAGTNGELRAQTDVKGNEIAFGEEYYMPATNGYTLNLTVDYAIQSFVEKAAADAFAQYNPKSIMCVAMNPQTGEILALCNKQSYDNNTPPRDDTTLLNELTRNRVLTDANDPGSIFKVFTLAASLNEGLTNENETFTCNGSIEVQGTRIRCTSSHGTISVTTGLAKSCNVVFVNLGLRLGTQRMYKYLNAFGFGRKTGVDMAAEASGIVIPEAQVKEGDLARIGFGQSISSTTIQTLNAFCSVVNGGKLLKPYIVKTVTDGDGKVVMENKTTVVSNPISEETSSRMRKLLKNVVTDGSGKQSYITGYTIGGKTGTAQKYDESGQVKTTHLSSFIAFAPVEGAQIAILFQVDEAQTASDYGSVVAAPYVGQILKDTLQYLKVQPSNAEQDTQEKAVGQVPSVLNLSQAEATAKLQQEGYLVVVNGSGTRVSTQTPVAGVTLQKGETVTITLTAASPSAEELTKVPNLIGKTKAQAQELLTNAGLTWYFHGTGKVTWQSKKADTQVPKNTEIRMELSE